MKIWLVVMSVLMVVGCSDNTQILQEQLNKEVQGGNELRSELEKVRKENAAQAASNQTQTAALQAQLDAATNQIALLEAQVKGRDATLAELKSAKPKEKPPTGYVGPLHPARTNAPPAAASRPASTPGTPPVSPAR